MSSETTPHVGPVCDADVVPGPARFPAPSPLPRLEPEFDPSHWGGPSFEDAEAPSPGHVNFRGPYVDECPECGDEKPEGADWCAHCFVTENAKQYYHESKEDALARHTAAMAVHVGRDPS